jgi:uncharacterized protein (DUF1800 family)
MIARATIGLLLAATFAPPSAVPGFGKRIAKQDEALHALNRLTFGPRSGDVDKLQKMGVKKWIEQQLNPDRLPENPELEARLKPLTTLTMSPRQLVEAYPPPKLSKAFIAGQGRRVLAHDLYEQKVYRAVYGNHQLEELLVDFWFNHLNIYLDKGAGRYLVTSYERDVIRPHVLGKFKDLLVATAEHPAMLFYLDNWLSVSPETAKMRGRRNRGLNENYARELLELHTLGVDGGYTQQDVIEIARCFTGWTIAQPYRAAEFTFNSRLHDGGEKTVLGVTIPAGGGKEDAVKVLDILSRHPSTARFVSTKLAQRFVADNPPDSLIKAMAKTFRKSEGDLQAVMRVMLSSREFWSEAAFKAKVKSPLEMVASALRATEADVTFAFGVANRVGDLGQPLYRKQEPAGYSNNSSEWVNSAALLARMNFALDLVQNRIPGIQVETARFGDDPQKVARQLLFSAVSPQTRSAIEKGTADRKPPASLAALILGSPEFQRR